MNRLACCLALAVALPAQAQDTTWDDLSALIFDEGQVLQDGSDYIVINSPYRSQNDARTQISTHVAAPAGALLDEVMLIIDENPMPVSAVFRFSQPVPEFAIDLTLRFDRSTPLHVVAQTTDGQLFVAETYVKTSGKGACSAPPGTDPELALATLGDIELGFSSALGTGAVSRRLAALGDRDSNLDIDISHPSHSGMQMDQITLLFIPMRYVETVNIDLDGRGYVDITGSISLAENPRLSLSVPSGTQSAGVTVTDTDGTISHAETTRPGY